MANLLQSNQQVQTTAPDYYTNYLSGIANQGQAAVNNAQYVGAQPLQTQAFGDIASSAGSTQPIFQQGVGTLNNAANTDVIGAATPYLSQAATNNPALMAESYMSPYARSTAQQMSDIAQRNIQQNLDPQATAAGVGSGQFGSQRGAQVLGQVNANAEQDLNANIANMLNTGYQSALTAAGQQQNLLGQLGSTAGNLTAQQGQIQNQSGLGLGTLGTQSGTQNLADINALATLGGQQQTIGQNQQLFPLNNLSTLSGMLRGYTVPTTTTTTANASPLSILGGGITGAAGLFTPNSSGITPYNSLISGLQNVGSQLFGNNSNGTNNTYDPTSAFTNNPIG